MSRLDILDAAFHYFSADDGCHDHCATYVFDSPRGQAPSTSAIVAQLGDRAAHVPELARRIARVPGDLDYPHWVVDDTPMSSRVTVHDLDGGMWQDVETLLGALKEDPLDAARRAWDVHVIRGSSGAPNTTGTPTVVVFRISHALTAGMGASALGRLLLSPNAGAPTPLPGHGAPTRPRELAAAAVTGALALPFRTARFLLARQRTRRAYLGSPSALDRPKPRPAVRGNADPTRHRVVHVTPFEPGLLRRRGLSVTVLALTAVGLANERFLAEFGEPIPTTFNAAVPVAVPENVDWPAANRVITTKVDLFTDEPDLAGRAAAIREALAAAKQRAIDPDLLRWALAENRVPAPLYVAARRKQRRHHEPNHGLRATVGANAVVVSVPHGPNDLDLCGARAVFSGDFPMLTDGHSITHGFYGLGDAVTLCLVACPDTFPDHRRYAEIMTTAVRDVAAATPDAS
nr:wax ester/triacylglycerol synthase domain-containing protein [Rhodococcus sp. (in: high G+C Gram-positive bacteria)]